MLGIPPLHIYAATAKNEIIKAWIISKQDGVIAGLDFCKAAFKLIGRETVFIKKVSDGKLRLYDFGNWVFRLILKLFQL